MKHRTLYRFRVIPASRAGVLLFIPRIDARFDYSTVISDVSPRPSFRAVYVEKELNLPNRQFGMISVTENLLNLLGYLSLLSYAEHKEWPFMRGTRELVMCASRVFCTINRIPLRSGLRVVGEPSDVVHTIRSLSVLRPHFSGGVMASTHQGHLLFLTPRTNAFAEQDASGGSPERPQVKAEDAAQRFHFVVIPLSPALRSKKGCSCGCGVVRFFEFIRVSQVFAYPTLAVTGAADFIRHALAARPAVG